MNYTFPELLTNRTILTVKSLISFVLVTYMFYSEVKLYGEIKCQSFLGVKGLREGGDNMDPNGKD